jgi:hypothetical protein
MFGTFVWQSVSRSYIRAARSSFSSSNAPPGSCRPMGRRSELNPAKTVTALTHFWPRRQGGRVDAPARGHFHGVLSACDVLPRRTRIPSPSSDVSEGAEPSQHPPSTVRILCQGTSTMAFPCLSELIRNAARRTSSSGAGTVLFRAKTPCRKVRNCDYLAALRDTCQHGLSHALNTRK